MTADMLHVFEVGEHILRLRDCHDSPFPLCGGGRILGSDPARAKLMMIGKDATFTPISLSNEANQFLQTSQAYLLSPRS